MENALVADGIWNSFRIWFQTIFNLDETIKMSQSDIRRDKKRFTTVNSDPNNILIKSIKFPSKMIYMFGGFVLSPTVAIDFDVLEWHHNDLWRFDWNQWSDRCQCLSLCCCFLMGFVTTLLVAGPSSCASVRTGLLLTLSKPCNWSIMSCTNMTPSVTRCWRCSIYTTRNYKHVKTYKKRRRERERSFGYGVNQNWCRMSVVNKHSRAVPLPRPAPAIK